MSEGWAWVQEKVAAARWSVDVVPAPPGRGQDRLDRLQLGDRSPLAGLTLNAAGLLVDHGWLRVLGCGGGTFEDDVATWNGLDGEAPNPSVGGALLVGHDAAGGFFAWFASEGVRYFAPDTLEWEDVAPGYSPWLELMLTGDLATFASDLRWPGWEEEVAELTPDQGLFAYPPPFTKEGRDRSQVHRKPVPMREIWSVQHDFRRQLNGGKRG